MGLYIVQKLKSKIKQEYMLGLGIVTIIFGLFLFSFNYISIKINYAYDYMNIQLLKNEQPKQYPSIKQEIHISDSDNATLTNPDVTPTPTSENKINNSYYIGTLEIPKISFKRGFVSKTSKFNDVNKNITILESSNYPDQKKGNFIIAAHSGNSKIAYFANLYKLAENDIAIVFYKNKKYTYQIVNIYTQPKIGKVTIYRNREKDVLTLITCTKDDSKSQTIYIAEKIKEENV